MLKKCVYQCKKYYHVKYYRFYFGNNPEQNKSKQNTFFIVSIFSIVSHFDGINVWKLISYIKYIWWI